MTTSVTNTFQAQDTNAHFQAWVNEVFTALVTTCGLTQTADTGQMAVPCVTAAPSGASQSAGYYVFKFNDTLQATAPIFLKVEFGSGASGATYPQMWITVGTGSNGAGTINGVAMTRVACGPGSIVGQSTSNYSSYFCYNAAQGFLGLAMKIGMAGTNQGMMGFFVFRTVNAAGAPTGDGIMLLTNSANASGIGTTGSAQCINNNTAAVQTLTAATAWSIIPYSAGYSQEGSTAMVFPVFQYLGSSSAPGWGITNQLAVAISQELNVGSTAAVTILGSLSLTYLNVGSPFGTTTLSLGYSVTGSPAYGVLMLWQ